MRDAGAVKINFAGGEPFLPEQQNNLGEMLKYSKECHYNSVSIISNGFFIKPNFFDNYGAYIDILGISCDSQFDDINEKIGRGKGDSIPRLRNIANLCSKHGIALKINTVVNKFNKDEDFSELMNELRPVRWKVFQVLPLDGENTGEYALRRVEPFLISDDDFMHFVDRHKDRIPSGILKAEDNRMMRNSYILVDEYGRFLDCSTGAKYHTQSIFDIGVQKAYSELMSSTGGGFDAAAFFERDGDYGGMLVQELHDL